MRTVLVRKAVRELSPADYRECWCLTKRERGAMASELAHARRFDPPALTYQIRERDTRKLLAWSLVFATAWPEEAPIPTLPYKYVMPIMATMDLCAHFYVRNELRRKGLGTRLATAISKDLKRPNVFAWNNPAQGFFRSVGYL